MNKDIYVISGIFILLLIAVGMFFNARPEILTGVDITQFNGTGVDAENLTLNATNSYVQVRYLIVDTRSNVSGASMFVRGIDYR